MSKFLPRLRRKDKLRERNSENVEENTQSRDWTTAESACKERVLRILERLQGALPISRDESEEAARWWKKFQEVAQVSSRLIDVISQSKRDELRFGNPEAILEALLRSRED
jgi:hypothetical protein